MRRLRTGYKDISGAYWRKVQKAAIQRDYAFSVTIKHAWRQYENQQKRCALSGVPIIMYPDGDRYYLQTASLDRIDSTKGYIKGNIQWVHKRVNFLKRDYPEGELVFWCAKIAKFSRKKYEEQDLETLRERRPICENIEVKKVG